MANIHSDTWYLRKFEDQTEFGPLPFPQLQKWAASAQIAPQDLVSDDGKVWIKAPMVPELAMDYLVQIQDRTYYGPTSSGAILEFYALGEISRQTRIINCKLTEETTLEDCEFFPDDETESGPVRGSLRATLQGRIRELEAEVLEKQRKLLLAEDTIRRLEKRLRDAS
jgi:hypothetical protein